MITTPKNPLLGFHYLIKPSSGGWYGTLTEPFIPPEKSLSLAVAAWLGPAINLCFWSTLPLPSVLQTYHTLSTQNTHPVMICQYNFYLSVNSFTEITLCKIFFPLTPTQNELVTLMYFCTSSSSFSEKFNFFTTFVFITELQNVMPTQLLDFWR